ncbi:hypothetical protein [Desulfogranum marinum]|uniref:hypothetical protein n=1 Tax=Desulfogranum marinum TaxID=453220 RepID=UPI0029C6BBA9|nr:hypothetical protein [Desulfogranum marinum]
MGTNINTDQATRDYLEYLFDHPGIITDQPSCASEGSYWLKKLLAGQCRGDEAKREMMAIINRWQAYHYKKARSLGWELDVEEFRKSFSRLGEKKSEIGDRPHFRSTI